MQFSKWCDESEEAVAKHVLRKFTADPKKITLAVKTVAGGVPDFYVDAARVAAVLKRLGKKAAAQHVQLKLPTAKTIRSGDLGEILCTSYVLESSPYDQGIKRLRWKDHRNMSMRGEDLLAFALRPGKRGATVLYVLKGEVKSAASVKTATITKARGALSANSGLPSPHAVSFVADRAIKSGDVVLGNAIDDVLLTTGIHAGQVAHLLFTFSGNDPSAMLKTNLLGYTGSFPQMYVSLRVVGHQKFIKQVFDLVDK